MGSEKSEPATAAFASAADADRRIAGVAAAARAVRAPSEAGAAEIQLLIGDGAPLAPATQEDIDRLRGAASVTVARGMGTAPVLPTSWQVLRTTGKPSDGLIARWINRPISQRVTYVVLAIPGVRPVHATIFNGLLALVMFAVLLVGHEAGLILGGLLFQAASIIDGVDGEMARATCRTSSAGATMDSVIDIATNLLFVSALSVNLALRDGGEIGWVGGWAVTLSILGGTILGLRARAGGGPIGFDLLKRSGTRIRGFVDLVYWVVQMLTGRDCFAFLFMVLILTGLERTALSIYAAVGTLWLLYVLVSSLPVPRAFRGTA